MLSRALPYYLKSWHDIDETVGLFGTEEPQTFNMKSVGSSSPVIEYVVRPHAAVCCILASFLRSDETALLLLPHISLDEARSRVIKGVRWLCETHLTGTRDVPGFLHRHRWGENWRSSMWASLLGLCCNLGSSYIDRELMESVKRVVAFEGNRFIGVLPPSGCEEDTKLEENAQDAMVLAWAINLCPEHSNVHLWERALRIWTINVASSAFDKADHSEYCDKSVAHWVCTQTLYPDMTAENNGFFSPELLSYGTWVVLAIAAYNLNGKEEPSCFHRKSHQETYEVLLRFTLPNGMVFSPGGQDLPMFTPRPFALAWGLWNNDPRALRLTERLLDWMEGKLKPGEAPEQCPWVIGFKPSYEGWELNFQSNVGFELAMLATLPFPEQFRFYTSGQIEGAVDTKRIYPFVQLCYRRNTRTTRSVAWKALGHHPVIGFGNHAYPELIASSKASLLGIPAVGDRVRTWNVLFHNDRPQKDGFDSYGRMCYYDAGHKPILRRDFRVITWGDEGLIILDQIIAEQDIVFDEQFLSPLYLVNDHWTGNQLRFCGGSLRETFRADQRKYREISCPSFWASIEDHVLFQFVWGMNKGLMYVPGGERNAPPYWMNCRLDMLAVHMEARQVAKGETAYNIGFYLGVGKGPRPFKSAGNAGEFFRGLVIMDGKNTLGLD